MSNEVRDNHLLHNLWYWNRDGVVSGNQQATGREARRRIVELKEELARYQWTETRVMLPPELDRDYLVFSEFWETPQVKHFTIHEDTVFWSGRSKFPVGQRVTHWMPLPPRPEV